ncbi:MAG TPA: alpha/beta fold hydrolase, partial [Thermoanaerobaculia bacterium]|nr:alpha/beta fold hydrolase [Thermoanaerobaculia bacterium]
VLAYLELARRLGRRRAVWAFQARGLADGVEPHRAVEEMAEDYLRLLREVRPEGPWALGGWSFGGLVAFEMARRLESQGEEVSLLALLDSVPVPAGGTEAPPAEAELLLWFFQDLSSGRPAGDRGDLEELAKLDSEARQDLLLARVREAGLLPERGGRERLRRLVGVFQANAAAAARYRPGASFGGEVLLLAAAEGVAGGAAPAAMAWGDLLAGPVEATTVPGNHYTLLLAPHVQEVAERLEDSLNRRRPAGLARMEDEPCLGIEA